VLLLLVVLSSCRVDVKTRGRVIDAAGQPVQGATLRLTKDGAPAPAGASWSSDIPGVTNGSGCIDFGGGIGPLQQYGWQLLVSKPGYKPATTHLETIHDSVVSVTLARESSLEESSIRHVSEGEGGGCY
jgi:hypothetical protein